jgi:hypothetical protein
MEIPTLQWNGAQVKDGKLVVEIAGDRPKGWKSTFDRTVKLLDSGRWGAITLKAGKVRVGSVDEGTEESLHHFLESVMLEVNTALVDDDEDHEDHEEEPEAPNDGAESADTRMTERFRGLQAS